MTTTTSGKATTRTIGGQTFTLTTGRRYMAGRPMIHRGQTRFDVTITDITDGFRFDDRPAATVSGLTYDEANALLAAFNDGETSFEGRVW